MRGDLLLYKSTGKWYERAISIATHGPYVHVSIVINDMLVIEASLRGICYNPLPPLDEHITVVELEPYHATGVGIRSGLAWAEKQEGKKYGWLDIIYQAVKFLNPNNPFRFGQANHWDCSDFATRYLLHAGVQLPDDYEPYTVTPNDLARWAGKLAPRRERVGT